MRIAIIGAGVSGLCAAYQLRGAHDVTVFDGNSYAGGHVNTVPVVDLAQQRHAVDTGFIVFNERTYPNFCRLLNELHVESQPSDMSFSVRCDHSGLEYAGTGWNGVFAQRMNLLRPGFWRLLRDWRRFGREGQQLLEQSAETLTVAEYFQRHSYSREFREQYFLPIGSAIWSCPHERLAQFPMRFIIDFYHNHGLLTLEDPPQWRVIRGGSQQYVQALLRRLPRQVRLGSPVRKVIRETGGVRLRLANGDTEQFDHAILACHADQSLALLGDDASSVERQVLSAFPYEKNVATLHTDGRVMPGSRRAWASWNYRIPATPSQQVTVTYHMNRLQSLPGKQQYFVTLNGEHWIDPSCVLRTFHYQHPVYSLSRVVAQRRHRELIDHEGLSYCGAYWGNGFHEDGVNSALAVTRVLREVAEPAGSVRA